MNKLYFTIGLARSGKSTLVERWAKYDISFDDRGRTQFFMQEGNHIPKRVVVSPDSIRLSLGHRFNWHVEPFVHATSQVMAKTLFMSGYDVVIDCTNTTQESILKWLYICNDAIPIVVDTDVEECKQRARQTNQADLVPVIQRMYEQAVENFGKNYVNLDSVMEKLREKVRKNASVGAITNG